MMSRTLKFRFWDPYIKKMMGPYSLYEQRTAYEVTSHCFDYVMQYTEIKDKNGVEVFEGDLITVGCSNPSEVYWDDEACQLRADDTFEHIPLGLLEVIGNIYETIKEGKE